MAKVIDLWWSGDDAYPPAVRVRAARATATVLDFISRSARGTTDAPPLTLNLEDPEAFLKLASLYAAVRDHRSVFTCVYAYTAIRHPDQLPPDAPTELYLGKRVLDVYMESHRCATEPT